MPVSYLVYNYFDNLSYISLFSKIRYDYRFVIVKVVTD